MNGPVIIMKTFQIIAHRGARIEAPENTIPAFKRAIELGADGIELDVRLTRDGIPVIIHDEHVENSNGKKIAVCSVDYKALSAIDIGSRLSPKFAGVGIPRLEEVLELVSPHDIQLIIEVKAQNGLRDKAARIVGETVRKYGFRRPPILSSSSIRVHVKLKKHDPDFMRALILIEPLFSFFPSLVFAKFFSLSGMHLEVSGLKKTFIRICRIFKLHCFFWTVKLATQMKTAREIGADGIIVDDVSMIQRELTALT